MGQATVKPHRIKPAKTWIREEKRTRTRTYHGPLECPDCGIGLYNRGHDSICYTLYPGAGLESAEGGVWACGVKADG